MKVVINRCFGGYGLSEAAYKVLGLDWNGYGNAFRDDRANPRLVDVVEQLGEEANGRYAALKIIEIPDNIDWEIDEYDGMEKVAEKHCNWS